MHKSRAFPWDIKDRYNVNPNCSVIDPESYGPR